MKTFLFIKRNSSAVLTISAKDFLEAFDEFTDLVSSPTSWRCENEEGEDED